MNSIRGRLYILLIFLFILYAPTSASSGEKGKEGASGDGTTIVIKSDTLELDDGRKTVSFIGRVEAVKDNFRIECRKIIVTYLSGSDVSGMEKNKIDKIVATGNVKIVRKEGGIATAEKAVYYQGEEKIVLTGNPRIVRGEDSIEGERVILFLNDKRSIVEGSGEQKVRAVFSPRREKK
ncbi:MAG: lipopolysaccharide transport periplasmic protein LptA [Deltaproteobacteria bacterium]|nr:lipopolysaccharide transport periplasmic protein LptA [Deltaproteobacteria bacterium]MBW2016388.1 lipopolysaccharide transport periplasmic protein LptA [Deltaproteobacteria bacterium]MBW2129712.1 lipopolysaccharide transport periplasmic protein LptA [Deltaproteobacteria bacterium]MBW2304929.1 lipopolysaccharide transport periplasmic protein LptA [Deltaproteobacteria bacterium]